MFKTLINLNKIEKTFRSFQQITRLNANMSTALATDGKDFVEC